MKLLRQPQLFPLSVLTAAGQDAGVKPHLFMDDPISAAIQASANWIEIARKLGLQGIQLSAALAKPDAYLPAEQMLDPVAAHGPWRTPRDGEGQDLSDEHAQSIIAECNKDDKPVKIFDLGFFENLLHPDQTIRAQIHAHLLRCARASQKLKRVGCAGVTTFIGGDPALSLDENLIRFEVEVIPLLMGFQKLGQKLWVENCPMPGWTPAERFMQNIACTPFMWALMHRIADKHGVGDVFRVTYDASHSILMGSRPLWDFLYLKAVRLEGIIDRFHGKAQNRRLAKVAAHGLLGQRAGTGIFDFSAGELFKDPRVLGNAWKRMTAEHTLPGVSQYSAYANYQGHTVDWLEHMIGARAILGINPLESVFHIEHEWGPARDQNLERVSAAIGLSARFIEGIDFAADANVLAEEWCKEVGLPWEATEDPLRHLPGLDEALGELLSIVI